MLEGLRRGVARMLLGDSWNNVNNNAVFNIVGYGQKSLAGPRVSQLTALAIPTVWACVSLIAEQISQCPVTVYRRQGDKRERADDHPVSLLLREPNTPAGLGMPDLVKHCEVSKGLWGEAFWQIERGASGGPVALWPLESAVTYATTGDRVDSRGIEGYETLIGRKSSTLNPADVCHFRRLSLTGFSGASPVHYARNALGLTMAMEKFGSEFFANEAKSGGFIMHPGKLTDVAKENIRKSVEDQQKTGRGPDQSGKKPVTGDKESHRVKIFEEGMKWVATTISPNESQFLESREHQVAEIARMYRIPLVMVQSLQGSTMWGTGVESLFLGFVNMTLKPLIVADEDELSRKLLTAAERAAGFEVDIDESVLLVGDAASRAEVNLKACGGPWKSRNEARRADGLNPIDGLDEIMTPVNMTDPANLPPEPTPAPTGAPKNV